MIFELKHGNEISKLMNGLTVYPFLLCRQDRYMYRSNYRSITYTLSNNRPSLEVDWSMNMQKIYN